MIVHYVLVAIFVKISTLDKRWTKKRWGHLIVDLKMGIFAKNPRIRSHINKFAKVDQELPVSLWTVLVLLVVRSAILAS